MVNAPLQTAEAWVGNWNAQNFGSSSGRFSTSSLSEEKLSTGASGQGSHEVKARGAIVLGSANGGSAKKGSTLAASSESSAHIKEAKESKDTDKKTSN